MNLNLARSRFHNLKPVRRAALLLWVAALGLAVVNARTYWRHFTGENQTRLNLQDLDTQEDAERAALAEHRQAMRRFDVPRLNERTVFVNEQIGHRTFSWSGLFDRVAEVLPDGVRLTSLDPELSDDRRSSDDSGIEEGEILLVIDAVARDGEQILAFIDHCFVHPAFRAPDLEQESLRDNGVDFSLSLIYRPDTKVPEGFDPAAEVAASKADPPEDGGDSQDADAADAADAADGAEAGDAA